MSSTSARALRVLVAGGGVAGVECLLGLRELAGDRVELTLLSDRAELRYRPLAVGEPFGGAHAPAYPLDGIAHDAGARLVRGAVERFDPVAHAVVTADGQRLAYDLLVVAFGTVPATPAGLAEAAIDPADTAALTALRDELRSGAVRRLAIVLPPGPHWALPGYELALLLAHDAAGAAELTLATAEAAPLELFGPEPSRAVADELAAAGVRVVTGAHAGADHLLPTAGGRILGAYDRESARAPEGPAAEGRGGRILGAYDRESARGPEGSGGAGLAFDRVVALPELRAPAMPGLPTSADGFLAVDAHGRVARAPDVYAAGDCTAGPVKQGGVSAQQADAVAEHIAFRAGAPIEPRPLHAVLRARLLGGSEPIWLRRDAADPADPGEAAHHALWWPPDKIAGRWLAPYLAARDDAAAGVPHPTAHGRRVTVPPSDVPVPRDLDLLGDPPSPDADR